MGWVASTWSQLWPNLLASFIWGTPAFVIHYRLVRRHINKNHESLRHHIVETIQIGPHLDSDE